MPSPAPSRSTDPRSGDLRQIFEAEKARRMPLSARAHTARIPGESDTLIGAQALVISFEVLAEIG